LRKVISIVFSVFLAASILIFPTGSVAAKPDSPPQMSAPSPAQSAEEDAIIKDILVELDAAGKMTNDPDIRKHIDVLKDWIKKLREMIRRGDKKAALDTKYLIAERLEWLINQLPVVTAPTTLAAATPSPNPLYDELVRIRMKLDKLIALERMPEAVPPPPPEIQRPPETERFGVYSVKFLCGPAFGKEGVQPGSYSTAINVHNPHNQTVYLYKKAVIAKREDEPRGRISGFRRVMLAPDEAIEIDCIDIVSLFRSLQRVTPVPPTRQLTTATQLQMSVISPEEQPTPQNQPTVFAKGFVVIYASAPLDVVAVYTASTAGGFSLDVEYVGQTTSGSIYVPPPEEGEECPVGCVCLSKDDAYKRYGPNAATCTDQPCGRDQYQNPLYCWKPGEQAACPQGCACLTKDEAYQKFGANVVQCQDAPCGYATAVTAAAQIPRYCWKPGEQVQCPQGCYCLSKDDAAKRGYTTLCSDQPCGRDQYQNLLYCWKSTPTTTQPQCPEGCYCLSKDDAAKRGYTALCMDQPCSYDQYKNPLYCWKYTPPTATPPTTTQCPQGCDCLTKNDAYQKYGANAIQCQDAPCGYVAGVTAAVQTPKYCFKPAPTTTQPQCPQGCYCLTKDDAAKRGYTTLCLDQPCGYDQYKNPLYCWKPPATTGAPATQPLCPSGCTCLTKAEAEKQGYTVLCQDAPCGYDQYQNPKYCFKKPTVTVPLIPRTIK